MNQFGFCVDFFIVLSWKNNYKFTSEEQSWSVYPRTDNISLDIFLCFRQVILTCVWFPLMGFAHCGEIDVDILRVLFFTGKVRNFGQLSVPSE